MPPDHLPSFAPLIGVRTADIVARHSGFSLEPALVCLMVLDEQHALVETVAPRNRLNQLALFREILVTPCTANGRPLGPAIPALARQIRNHALARAQARESTRRQRRLAWFAALNHRLRGLRTVYYDLVPNSATPPRLSQEAFHGTC